MEFLIHDFESHSNTTYMYIRFFLEEMFMPFKEVKTNKSDWSVIKSENLTIDLMTEYQIWCLKFTIC